MGLVIRRQGGSLALTLTAAYLVFELAFNARLLDVAGGMPDQDSLKGIEFFGRVISGVGASLMVWRLIAYRLQTATALLLVGMSVGPLVYFGQELIVNEIVDHATTQEKVDATYATTLSIALLRQAVEVKGIELDPTAYSKPEGKTFFAVFPLLAYSSPKLLNQVAGNLEPLVEQTLRAQVGRPEDVYNQNYLAMVNDIRRQFNDDYLSASRRILQAQTDQLNIDDAWIEYQDKVGRQPFTAESATASQRTKVIHELRKKGIDVPDGWQLNDRLGFEASMPLQRANSRFRERANAILGGATSINPGLTWSAFCIHPDVQHFARTKLIQRFPQLGSMTGFIDLNANFETFRDHIYGPHVKAEAKQRSSALRRNPASFDKGGINYEQGQQSMRAIVVPPLALGFSLFFGLVNLAGLLSNFGTVSRRSQWLIKVVFIGAIIAVPLSFPNTVSRSPAYIKLESTLHERSQVGARALQWLVQSEPLFYPVTNLVRQYVLFGANFKKI